jgi:predicted ArsR family transcriptional regulator
LEGIERLSDVNVSPEKQKQMQERDKERSMILQEMKKSGASTVEELSKTTGIEPHQVLLHLIAMRQFGKVAITGERDKQLVYEIVEGK